MSITPISVEKEYEKNPELKKEDILTLKEWVQKQPHLPNIEELELILFLHANMYRIEAAKVNIDVYYTVRTHTPEFFTHRDANKDHAVQNAMEIGLFEWLPGVTDEGYKVMLAKLMVSEPARFVYAECIKVFIMVSDLWLHESGTSPGLRIVFDMECVQLGHIGKLSLVTMNKLFIYLQDAFPVRLKGLHFINTVSFMDKLLSLMKPLMKNELLDMLHLHEKVDSLLPFVPKRCLPKDFGGDSLTLAELHENTKKRLMANARWFEEEEKDRVIENMRPEKDKTPDELFGMEGSFKKLDID